MTNERTFEQRLAVLEAIEAIKTLKHRYWRYCDSKDPDGFRSCFIRNGASMDYGPLGAFDDVEPILQIFIKVALRKVDDRYVVLDMHHGVMPNITILSETEAEGTWTLRFRQVNLLDRTDRTTAGEYDDRYVIEDGEWKMSSSHFRPLWSITRPITDDIEVAQFLD